MKPLQGIIVSLLTPFTVGQEVDLPAMRRLVRFLLAAGVHGFYVTGSAGEWVRLSNEERRAIANTVIEETAGRVPVVVHTGHHHTQQAVDLTRHAASIGADYVSSVVPGNNRNTTAEVVEYYRAIAAVGTPVIVYHLEGELSPQTFVEYYGPIAGITGLKYSAADLFPMQAVYHLSAGRIRVWSGHDQMALAGLLMNGSGVIGTNYNYIPEIYVDLYEAYSAGDLRRAQRLQEEANTILLAVKKFGNLPAYKAALALRGLPVGDGRLPMQPLTNVARLALRRTLEPFANYFKSIDIA